jgi:hypothetical protein
MYSQVLTYKYSQVQRGRERDRETERETERERQRDRETEGERKRQTERERERERDRETDKDARQAVSTKDGTGSRKPNTTAHQNKKETEALHYAKHRSQNSGEPTQSYFKNTGAGQNKSRKI